MLIVEITNTAFLYVLGSIFQVVQTQTKLAFSQKISQCILGSFGGTKYMVTGVKYVKE
jgi:hypothetical protein